MGFFSGDSSSSSTTNNVDQRLFQEAGAIGATSSGGGTSVVTVNALDGGAINKAFGLGDHAIDSVTDFATSALSGAHHTTELALSGALSSVQDSKDAFKEATSQVASAYEEARVGNKNIMIMAGLALAFMAFAVMASRGHR